MCPSGLLMQLLHREGRSFLFGDALLIVFVKVSINVNVMDSALSQPFVYPGYLGITKYSTYSSV